jgi:hypothetical protein
MIQAVRQKQTSPPLLPLLTDNLIAISAGSKKSNKLQIAKEIVEGFEV